MAIQRRGSQFSLEGRPGVARPSVNEAPAVEPRSNPALLNQPKGGLRPAGTARESREDVEWRSPFRQIGAMERMGMTATERTMRDTNMSWRDKQPDFTSQPMFMTAREITETHSVLDADREEVEDLDADPEISFARPYRAPGVQAGTDSSLPGTRTGLRQALDQFDQQGFGKQHTRHGTTVYVEPGQRIETAAEVWDRKREESDSDYSYGENNDSLYESVAEHGIKSPVHLATEQFSAMTHEGGPLEPGQRGQPVIVGGHHRLSVAAAEDPDRLVPVLRHKDIQHAKVSREYPYT